MKTLLKKIAITGLLSVFMQACIFNYERGNGKVDVREISVESFERINIGGNYDVTLIKSNDTKVVIETDENLQNYINTELYDKTLNINNVHNLKSTDGINIEIYYHEINKIYSTGASKLSNDGILETEELIINLSGAGAINLEIQTSKVKVNLTGAGVIVLSGDTDFQETHISGAGGLSANELRSKTCSINLSGLGGAEVHVVEKLEATITGVGGIVYSGNPQLIERQVTGFGKITRSETYIEDIYDENSEEL
jgi:hypothetical protein